MTSQTLRYEDAVRARRDMGRSLDLWWRRMQVPLAVFVVLAALFATTRLDVAIAHLLFFDDQRGWIGGGSWWTNELLHATGQLAIRLSTVAAIALWLATFFRSSLRALRRPTGYAILAFVLSVSVVGLLKLITNIHCPWDLVDFGGNQPYVHLFAHRSPALPRGQCFPAGHASSGYALLVLFFVLEERSARWAKIALSAAVLVGLTFGLGQQSRGAHFLSHDLWSAFLVWTVSLSVYVFVFRCRLWQPLGDTPPPH